MKQIFEIKDQEIINSVLDQAEYGTLAVSMDNIPYSVPVNFVRIGEDIYFHGALGNRKMKALKTNPKVSFSVVENYSIIASFFSSTAGSACPSTQFFKSISMDGVASVVESREEKAMMFTALMEKLQPEGGYTPFEDAGYDKAIKATAVVKIVPVSVRAKFKFGQHLNKERFDMILAHLEKRGSTIDLSTIRIMKKLRN